MRGYVFLSKNIKLKAANQGEALRWAYTISKKNALNQGEALSFNKKMETPT